MSFADELKDLKPKSNFNEEIFLRGCEYAIKHACEEAQLQKKHKIKGNICADEYSSIYIGDTSGSLPIIDEFDGVDVDLLKNKIEQIIVSLGFTNYKVKAIKRVVEIDTGRKFIGKTRKRTDHVFHLEIKW